MPSTVPTVKAARKSLVSCRAIVPSILPAFRGSAAGPSVVQPVAPAAAGNDADLGLVPVVESPIPVFLVEVFVLVHHLQLAGAEAAEGVGAGLQAAHGGGAAHEEPLGL